jgi:UPF0716 family protein affecting phage T7 exclusion
VLYFILFLFVEVMVTSNISGDIGGLMTFIEIILSAGVGFFLLINFRYTVAQSMSMLMSGEMSVQEFKKLSLFSLLGAVLLIIPGFFSDMLGVALQFSFIGTFIAKKIFKFKKTKIHKKEENEIIDVEVIDIDTIK